MRPPGARPADAAGGAVRRAADERRRLRNLVELQLNWDPAVVPGAGRLQRLRRMPHAAAGVRMCPIFRFKPAEEASPRAKANLLRGVLTGKLDLSHPRPATNSRPSPNCACTATCAAWNARPGWISPV